LWRNRREQSGPARILIGLIFTLSLVHAGLLEISNITLVDPAGTVLGQCHRRHDETSSGPGIAIALDTAPTRGMGLEGVTGPMSRNPSSSLWSGRPDSNRRRPAWEVYFTPQPVSRDPKLAAQTVFATRDDTRCPQRSQEMVTRMVTRRTRRGGSPGYGSISSTRLMRSRQAVSRWGKS